MVKHTNLIKPPLLLILTLTLLLTIQPPPTPTAQETTLTIALYTAPDRLPADGGLYPSLIVQLEESGEPTIAPYDIEVTLSSTDETVGMVPPQVTIPKGQIHIVTDFQTTKTPGTTTITALAQKAVKSSLSVTTIIPTGTPTKLGIYAVPASIPAEPGMTSLIVVQLEDSRSLPVRAPIDTEVTLTLTKPKIGTIESKVTIPTGQTQTFATFHATYNVGSTEIRASAKSYTSAAVTVTTVGSEAKTLKLYALPTKLHILDQFGWLTVQLQDSSGYPAKATSDLAVTITSTDPNIAYAESAVTIKTGKTQATSRVVLKTAGTVTLTALSEGFTPSSASITITAYTQDPNTATTLGLTAAPSTIPSDGGLYIPLAVQLLDSSGNPTWQHTISTVSFSLDNPDVGGATTASIDGRTSYALVKFQTSYTPGTTKVYTIAQGFSTISTTLKTYGPSPDKMFLAVAPAKIYADNQPYNSFIVQMQDSSSKPAKTSRELIVSLDSSNPEVGSIESRAIIRGGSDHAVVQFHSTNTPGTTTIEAIAEGYSATSITVTTYSTDPSKYTLFSVPSKILANGETYNSLYIKLLDSGGSPTIAWEDITLQLMSTDIEVGTVNPTLTIPKGSAFTVTEFHSGTIAGETTVNALSGGFTLATVTATTFILTTSINITAEPPSVKVDEEATINVAVTSEGLPLPLAPVTFEANIGTFTSNTTTTDLLGNAETTYLSSEPGTANITVTVNKPGYDIVVESINVIVTSSGTATPTSTSTPEEEIEEEEGVEEEEEPEAGMILGIIPANLDFLTVIIIIIAIVAAAAVIMLRRIRPSLRLSLRRRPTEI